MSIRRALIGVLMLSFALACGRGRDGRLDTLIADEPILTLISAAGVVAGADSVCSEVIVEWWNTYFTEDFRDRTTPERLAIGHDWLRRQIAGMPRDARETALARIEGRVEAYQSLMSLDCTLESLATAVAMTPSLVDLLPSNINSRANNPMEVGWTLASAEHAELQHALAGRLGDMQPHERAAVMRGLKETVAWAEAQQMGSDREP